MRRIKIILIISLAFFNSSCSVFLTNNSFSNREDRYKNCSRNYLWPGLDTFEVWAATGLGGPAVGLTFAGFATYGFINVYRCRKQKLNEKKDENNIKNESIQTEKQP